MASIDYIHTEGGLEIRTPESIVAWADVPGRYLSVLDPLMCILKRLAEPKTVADMVREGRS